MSYNRMRFAVGLFVIILSVAILFFIFAVLKQKGTFEKRYSYHFTTKSASSFSVGMPLKFSGFKIGVIDDISLTNDGSVFMTFSVTKENQKWISQNSVLIIKKPLIGSPHIEVHSAIGNPPLKPGSSLEILISDDINDMIARLEPTVQRIINIIDSLDSIASRVAKEDSDLFLTLKNIRIFSEKLSKNDSLLTTITGEQTSTKSLVSTLDSTAKTMQEIHQISQKANNLIGSLDKKIIDPSSDAIKDLDSKIIEPSSDVVKKLDAIMKDVKQKLKTLDASIKVLGGYDKELLNIKEQVSVGIQKSNQIMDKVDSLMQDKQDSEVQLP